MCIRDRFKQAADVVDNLYNNWYLANLTQNWTNAAGKQLAATGYIEGIEQQTDFYEKHVAQATSRTFVIISDAMRYEVAASLSIEMCIRDRHQRYHKSSKRETLFFRRPQGITRNSV